MQPEGLALVAAAGLVALADVNNPAGVVDVDGVVDADELDVAVGVVVADDEIVADGVVDGDDDDDEVDGPGLEGAWSATAGPWPAKIAPSRSFRDGCDTRPGDLTWMARGAGRVITRCLTSSTLEARG